MELNTLGKGLLESFGDEYYNNNVEEELDVTDLAKLLDTEVKHQFATPTVGTLYTTLVEGFYEIPDFQRKFVWNKKQVALLALSIIKGIPIPPLYTYKKDRQEVLIDGQQRSMSIFLYFNDLFVVNKKSPQKYLKEIDALCREYDTKKSILTESDDSNDVAKAEMRMKEIERELVVEYGVQKTTYTIPIGDDQIDITFSRFDIKDQRYLKQREMYVTRIDCGTGNVRKLYVTIFALLNTAGKQLGAQEIRNGLFIDSTLYKEIAIYNSEDGKWRDIFGDTSIHSKDMEMLIKMLALEYFTEVNEEGVVTIKEDRGFTFNWSNLIVRFSEITEKGDPSEYIQKLKKFFDNIDVDKKSKVKCNPAVLEAFFVVTTKLNYNMSDKKLSYADLCKIGEGKTIEFPKVLSNLESVNERLKRTTELVKELENA